MAGVASGAGSATPTGSALDAGQPGKAQAQGKIQEPGKPGGAGGEHGGKADQLSTWAAFFVILFGGAVGGFVDGLRTDVQYRLTKPGRVRHARQPAVPEVRTDTGAETPAAAQPVPTGYYELGWVGDVVTGAVAAFSVFAVSAAVFPVEAGARAESLGLIRLMGVSMVAGYLGPMLLRLIKDKAAVAAEAKSKAVEANSRAVEATTKAVDAEARARKAEDKTASLGQQLGNLRQAEQTMAAVRAQVVDVVEARLAARASGAARGIASKSPEQALDKVLVLLEAAAKQDPDSAAVQYELGWWRDEQARHLQGDDAEGQPRADLAAARKQAAIGAWKAAVAAFARAVALDPQYAKAHYNLACAKAKANQLLAAQDRFTDDEVVDALVRAIKLVPGLRGQAGDDQDLADYVGRLPSA